MADTKFSALSFVASVVDATEWGVNDAGTSKKAAASQIAAYLAAKGLVPEYITTCDADFAGQNVTTPQNIFPANQDTFTSPANQNYLFELLLFCSLGTVTCIKSLSFGGSATISSIRYASEGQYQAINTAGTTQTSGQWDTAAAAAVLPTGTPFWWLKANGMMRIGAAGTIIPQITFSADPTGTILFKKDSYMRMRAVGSDTFAANGAWG